MKQLIDMKKLFTLLLFLHFVVHLNAQIPNGGFESWVEEYNYEKPTDWNTNQDTLYSRVLKSDESIEGEFSLLLSSESPSAWVDCNSLTTISTAIDPINSEGEHLSFYLKCLSIDSTDIFFHFRAIYYANETKISEDSYIPQSALSEFSLIELGDIPIGSDSLQIVIVSGASNGADDGCYNYTNAWVDGLRLNKRTSTIQDNSPISFEVFPNPSAGVFNVKQQGNEYKNYRVLDILGREIQTGNLTYAKFELTKKGPYFLQAFSSISSSRDVVRKIIVE